MKKYFRSVLMIVGILFLSELSGMAEEIGFVYASDLPSNNMGTSVETKNAVTGACGENATWTLDNAGVLTVSGTGRMFDYDGSNQVAPWLADPNDVSGIRKIVIDHGITHIGDFTFFRCFAIQSIDIPESVQSIGNSAFEGCSGIEGQLKLPEGIQSIGNSTFYGCESIVGNLVIPDSVLAIGDSAFYLCTGIESVTLGKELKFIKDFSFGECNNLVTVNVFGNTVYKSTSSDQAVSPFYSSINIRNIVMYNRECSWQQLWHDSIVLESDKALYGCKDSKLQSEATEYNLKFQYVCDYMQQHTWKSEFTIDEEATCIEKGMESIHCNICDAIQENSNREMAAKGHIWDLGQIEAEPNCINDGSKQYNCTVCAQKKDVSEKVKCAEGNHVYGSWVTIRKPTIERVGERQRECRECKIVQKESIKKLTGQWRKDGVGWWYSLSNGSYLRKCRATIGSRVYTFNAQGYMQTGWQYMGGKWYYFNGSGQMQTGWLFIGGVWYYLNPKDGMMLANQWLNNSYLKSSGAMAVGWLKKLGQVHGLTSYHFFYGQFPGIGRTKDRMIIRIYRLRDAKVKTALTHHFKITKKTFVLCHIKANDFPCSIVNGSMKGELLASAKPFKWSGINLNELTSVCLSFASMGTFFYFLFLGALNSSIFEYTNKRGI